MVASPIVSLFPIESLVPCSIDLSFKRTRSVSPGISMISALLSRYNTQIGFVSLTSIWVSLMLLIGNLSPIALAWLFKSKWVGTCSAESVDTPSECAFVATGDSAGSLRGFGKGKLVIWATWLSCIILSRCSAVPCATASLRSSSTSTLLSNAKESLKPGKPLNLCET